MRSTIFCLVLLLNGNCLIGQNLTNPIFQALEHDFLEPTRALEDPDLNRYSYSEKRHAFLFYYANIYQFGFTSSSFAGTWHHDLGAMYRGTFVRSRFLQLNLQTWLLASSLTGAASTEQFSRQLGMFSRVNSSRLTYLERSRSEVRNLYLEFSLFNGGWDMLVGKLDPYLLTSFTSYAGWDKYTFFNDGTTANQVVYENPGVGISTRFNLTQNVSIGGMIIDQNLDQSELIYFPETGKDFFRYYGFIKFSVGDPLNRISEHNVVYIYSDPTPAAKSSRTFIYTGNQQLTDKWIMVIKVLGSSAQESFIDGSYSLGMILMNPYGRLGDMTGLVLIANTKKGVVEPGLDAFWRVFSKSWIQVTPNAQMYYTSEDLISATFGIRAFLAI